MRVFGFHNGNDGVSFYRIWQPLKWMAKHGLITDRFEDEEDWQTMPVDRLEEARAKADLMFFGYAPGSRAPVLMNAMGKNENGERYKPWICDIDDNIMHLPKWHHHRAKYDQGKEAGEKVVEISGEDAEKLEEKRKHLAKTEHEFVGKVVRKGGKFYHVFPVADPLRNTLTELEGADLVTTTCENLKELYKPYNKNIEVLPNGIDPSLWPENRRIDDGYVRIGLTGSITHLADWSLIAPVLKDVLTDHKNVKLVINGFGLKGVSDEDYKLLKEKGAIRGEKGNEYHIHPDFEDLYGSEQFESHPPTELSDWPKGLASWGFDLAVAPLHNDKFNRGKSNLKLLEFGTLKIPAVYQYLEPYKRDIKQGDNGFTANMDQFRDRITQLVKSAELRKKIGEQSHNYVMENYHMDKLGKRYVEVFKRVRDKFSSKSFLAI